MVPLVMPARAAMSSIRLPAKPFAAKQASAASRISGARSSLRRVQRWVFIPLLITDWSVSSKEKQLILEKHALVAENLGQEVHHQTDRRVLGILPPDHRPELPDRRFGAQRTTLEPAL